MGPRTRPATGVRSGRAARHAASRSASESEGGVRMRRETRKRARLTMLFVVLSMVPLLMAVNRCIIPFGVQ